MTKVNKRPLRVLLVQGDTPDIDDLQETLTRVGDQPFQVDWAGRLSQALERLSRGGVDVILLDLDLPDSEGLITFERTHSFAPEVPVVLYTDRVDEEVGLSAVSGGAQDLLERSVTDPAAILRTIRFAIERNRLFQALQSLSLIDELTGLFNRRGFAELGEQHLKMARRGGRGVVLLYCDLDDFKNINDTYGHHVGDRALLELTEILRASFRSSDLLARISADDFAVMALEVSGEDVDLLIQRLKTKVEEFNQNSREPFSLSVSVGAAQFKRGELMLLEDMLAAADAAMYQDKRSKARGMLP